LGSKWSESRNEFIERLIVLKKENLIRKMPSFNGAATILFGGIVDRYLSNLGTKNYLRKTDINMPFRTYMCATLLTSLIATIFGIVGLFVIFNFIQVQTVIRTILFIGVPIGLGVICFAFFNYYPIQKVDSKRKNIEINLPFVVTHMGAIAESGVPPYMIFKLLAEFEEYGEVSKEMKKLVRNIDTFGVDPMTAIKDLAERTPSKEFKQILLGVVSATESGGDVKSYLKLSGEQALFNWKIKREKFLQQLSAYAEFYTGILIAAPLFIIALFSVMGMISPELGGIPILTLTKLSIWILVPVLNLAFLGFLRGMEVEM
jgi:flagellar protein FlaJ